MSKFLLSLLLILGFAFTLNAQFLSNGNGGTVLIKGKVLEKTSNIPMGVKISFIDSEGKKIKISSNDKTGEFEQLLQAGKNYDVVLTHPQILRSTITVATNSGANYSEQNQDFFVEKIRTVATLDNMDLFQKNSAEISPAGIENLDELKAMMRINRSLFINMKVNAHDTFTGKKNAKACEKLVQKRSDALDKYLDSWKTWKTRVNLVPDNSAGEKNAVQDVVVTVDKMEETIK